MKVIDLLNNINNGENIPQKIFVNKKEVFYYDNIDNFYHTIRGIDLLEYGKDYSTKAFLNFDVKIIGYQKEINIQDLSEIPLENITPCTDYNYQVMAYKYNDLVKAIKQLDRQIKENK